jgi:chromosome segregation ATPase
MKSKDKAKLKRELREIHTKKSSGHNVNLQLLAAIIAVLATLMVAIIYFSWQYEELLEENENFDTVHNTVNEQLQQCKEELDSAEMNMGLLAEELNTSSASRESLNALYSNLSEEKGELEDELSTTEAKFSSCQEDLSETEGELNAAVNDLNDYIDLYNEKVVQLQNAVSDIDELETTVSNLQGEISDLEVELAELRECVDNNNCTACDSL